MNVDNVFLISGIACLIAAVVGGGLKAFGIEVPALRSLIRQIVLGILGVILVVMGVIHPSGTTDTKAGRPEAGRPQTVPMPDRAKPTIAGGPIAVKVNNYPRIVQAGGGTDISVLATARDGSAIPGARVVLSAGGGAFQETGTTQAMGSTNEKGVYRTKWRTYEAGAYTGNMSYRIGVQVTKEGFDRGRGEIAIPVKVN
ncbi:MAG: hypothetical protein A4E62_02755 [Syntrophorhabdus sp. PtaU1.Bin002]|jgi:uncharacterized membrane protein|nr:MAG: hypothetical protein A4E62_02755 [Syntrophorhabdus sp. PtaU1.Bin002]